jgi:threonine/homoserine/homoserine lactone efflux protein
VPIDPHVLAFTGVAALLTISPGPDMALMLRNVLRGGSRVVLPTAIGTCSGLFAWGTASSLGVAAILAASAELYAVLRLAGAAYLVALGLLALRAAITGRHVDDPWAPPVSEAGVSMSGMAGFRSGLLTNLLNPKIGVFYATLLPQFIPPGAPPLPTSLLLAGIHAALGIAWLCLYGGLLARAGDQVRRGPVRRVLEGVTGAVLLALGARVALDAH